MKKNRNEVKRKRKEKDQLHHDKHIDLYMADQNVFDKYNIIYPHND